MKRRIFFILLVLLLIGAYIWQYPDRSHSLTVYKQKLVSETVPTGYVQTPRGGGIGSSDTKRPTFAELDTEPARISEQQTRWSWPFVDVYAARQLIPLFGEVYLENPLLTYGYPFQAGEWLKTAIRFDTYRAGIGWPLHGRYWQGEPLTEIALLDFGYAFSNQKWHGREHAFDSNAISRVYHHLTLRLGFRLRYQLTDAISVTLTELHSIPFIEGFDMTTESIVFHIKSDNDEDRVGTQRIHIEYEDGQAMPNHIQLETGFVGVGDD